MIKNTILIWFILAVSTLVAKTIDISQVADYSVLEHSKVYYSDSNVEIYDIINKNKFNSYHKANINLGSTYKTIWVSFELVNNSKETISKILVISSPLLNHIILHDGDNMDSNKVKGVLNIKEDHTTLYPQFDITIKAGASNRYWLEVRSATNPIDFGVKLYDKETYYSEDRKQQFVYTLLIGILIALMLHNFFQFFYMKERSYIYYSFYLFALIYQQLGYLGLSQIYFPHYILDLAIQKSVFKIALLIITAALFSMHFLKIKENPTLYKGYQLFIFIAIIEIFVLNGSIFYSLNAVVYTGILFIIFNIYSGYISYSQGNKQARLFIIGFSIVSVIYFLMALDAFGLTSIIFKYKYLLILMTTVEALILSLAFSDRYIILQQEKQKADALLLTDSKNRADIIESQVKKQTKELKAMVDTKELLIQEIHHRVKNNLQIILSMLRMQSDQIETEKDKIQFLNLENRINAIAKTYDMLIIHKNLEEINLAEYIDELLTDIQVSYAHENRNITIQTRISATLPLRESIYIGLILNELVTNTYKHAFKEFGSIDIGLYKQDDEYILTYEDDGKGFKQINQNNSLGLNLINQLVYHQLNGTMTTTSYQQTQYIIRFKL